MHLACRSNGYSYFRVKGTLKFPFLRVCLSRTSHRSPIWANQTCYDTDPELLLLTVQLSFVLARYSDCTMMLSLVTEMHACMQCMNSYTQMTSLCVLLIIVPLSLFFLFSSSFSMNFLYPFGINERHSPKLSISSLQYMTISNETP